MQRRLRTPAAILMATMLMLIASSSGAASRLAETAGAAPSVQDARAAAILALAREAMSAYDLRAVIVRVTVNGQELTTFALGESMTGVPATPEMHFRNGAVAITYVATVLLQLVDEGIVGLDDPIARWLPELPDADRVTLRMLANMTAGYPDYVQNPKLAESIYADPFRAWTPDDLIALGLSTPRVFPPGANWDYSHTDYVILGRALERITGSPLADLLDARILKPLGLKGTVGAETAAIPEPALHAFSSERRQVLGVPSGARFYEESSYWNPSWTLPRGSIQTSTIHDLAASAVAWGEGTLLSPASHQAQVAPSLLGFGSPLAGCPNCHTMGEGYNYGLGVVRSGAWLLQNPLFSGYAGVAAYLPGERIAIAVAVTYGEGSFDDEGNYKIGNAGDRIFRAVGALLAPSSAPPTRGP